MVAGYASQGKSGYRSDRDALGDKDLHRTAPMVDLPRTILKEAFAGRFDEKGTKDFNAGIRSGI